MNKYIRPILVLVLTLLGAVATANAQATTGAISGIVTDENQAVIANAKVAARNIGTNETRTTMTDTEGRFRLPNLPVGAYEITIEAKGFAKVVRTGVERVDLGALLRASGQDDDRHRRPAPDAADHVDAVDLGLPDNRR